jgi:hypothetical protein
VISHGGRRVITARHARQRPDTCIGTQHCNLNGANGQRTRLIACTSHVGLACVLPANTVPHIGRRRSLLITVREMSSSARAVGQAVRSRLWPPLTQPRPSVAPHALVTSHVFYCSFAQASHCYVALVCILGEPFGHFGPERWRRATDCKVHA